MKSLQESLFDSKTQMMESLFDNDLVDKSLTLPPGVIYDTIFQMVYCDKYLNKYLLNNGWFMNMNSTGIEISKVFKVKEFSKSIKVKSLFQFTKEKRILIPFLTFAELSGTYRFSSSSEAIARWIEKEFEGRIKIIKGEYNINYFSCDSESINQVCNIISLTFQAFASKNINQLIQKEIDMYEPMKNVPGVVLDQTIMKKVIKEIA